MDKGLEDMAIKLCETLPFNWTLFEEKGLCDKKSDLCYYCKRHADRKHYCHKQTTYLLPEVSI